jgi:ABC-type cobalt transport system substrate-binding protein
LIWEPPSGEIASLLFALSSAWFGNLLFWSGYLKGRSKKEENNQ